MEVISHSLLEVAKHFQKKWQESFFGNLVLELRLYYEMINAFDCDVSSSNGTKIS